MKKKTREEFLNELKEINSSIIVKGRYEGTNNSIEVECAKCGHIWNPLAKVLLRGHGCPKCAGNAHKSIEQFRDELKARRNDVSVIGEYKNANCKIQARCNIHNIDWMITPSKLLAGGKCPICAKDTTSRKRIQKFIDKNGSFADHFPKLLEEWNYDENRKRQLEPNNLTIKSNRKASWICKKCGYIYDATISNRSNGTGCPVCAGRIVIQGINDLFTVAPKLEEEWDYEENEKHSIFPSKISKGSSQDAHWRCSFCGNKWTAKIYSRIAGAGCPKCAMEERTSLPEQTIFFYLRQIDKDIINTYQPDWIKPSEIDIYLPSYRLGIEYDGDGFHKNAKKDEKKDDLCEAHGIKLLHVREPNCPKMREGSLVYVRPNKLENQLNDMIRAIVSIINGIYNSGLIINPDFVTDRNIILQQYLTKLKANSIAMVSEAMLDWDWEKNEGINPELISKGSNKKVWWKCHICGNESFGQVADHQTHRCSLCRRVTQKSKYRKIIIDSGKKDVQFIMPELAEEWFASLNNGSQISEYSYQSGKKVTWKCKKCNYVWKSTIANRVNGQGCPNCAGKVLINGKNDLRTRFPLVAKQWIECLDDPTKTPDSVMPGSNRKVRWRCQICKGEWIVSVNARTRNNVAHGCPYCLNEKVLSGFNDLQSISPEIALEWDYEKNIGQTPEKMLNKSTNKVWWKCMKCGHSWRAVVASRTGKQHSGCPECAKNRVGQHFKKKIMQYSLNGELINEYESLSAAADAVGISKTALCASLKRKNGSSAGFRWRYKE